MPVGNPSFGAYHWSYAGTPIGFIEGVPELVEIAEAIDRRSGLTGSSVIDGIYTGGQKFLNLIAKDWTLNVQRLIWPFGGQGRSGRHGRAMTDLARPIVATAVPGTPAAVNGPRTRTFHLACFAPGFNMKVPFGMVERNIAVTFRIYPTIDTYTGDLVWYTDS
jgi:hypothetical protein